MSTLHITACLNTDAKFLTRVNVLKSRLEECNAALDELLAAAEIPSVAVDCATAADGQGAHIAPLLQAIAEFKLELRPLQPRPLRDAAGNMLYRLVGRLGGGRGRNGACGPDAAVQAGM